MHASFKLGNRAQPLGAIYYDGAFAIAGRMGQRARMIPMTARITNPARAVQREFTCEVFNHPMFTGQIALTAALEFLDRVHFEMGEASATVRWRLQTRPFGEIRYENRVATRDFAGVRCAERPELRAEPADERPRAHGGTGAHRVGD
jgi:hypothetical protein